MRKFLLSFLALPLFIHAQSAYYHEYRVVDTSYIQRGLQGLCTLPGGDLLTFGSVNTTQGPSYAHLFRVDLSGNIAWSRQLNSAQEFMVNAISDNTNTYLISQSGYVSSLTKADAAMNFLWAKQFSGAPAGMHTIADFTVPAAGKLGIGGVYYSSTLNSNIPWITLMDTAGNQSWSKAYQYTDYWINPTDAGMLPTADKGFVIPLHLWHVDSLSNSYYGFGMMRVDSMGNPLWCRSYADSVGSGAMQMVQLPDSSYMISGMRQPNSAPIPHFFILKTDKNGNLLWSKYSQTTIETGWPVNGQGLIMLNDGNLLCAFTEEISNNPILKTKMDFAELDTGGNVIHAFRINDLDTTSVDAMVRRQNGEIVAAGYRYTNNSPHHNEYAVLIGIDSTLNGGCYRAPFSLVLDTIPMRTDNIPVTVINGPVLNTTLTPFSTTLAVQKLNCPLAAVEEETENSDLALYPNPSNGNVTLSLENRNFSNSSVCVFNSFGQKVFEARAMQDPFILIPSSEWSPGLYLVCVVNENGMRIAAGRLVKE